MTAQDMNAALFEAVERELARTEYPDALPPLPDLPAGRYVDPAFYALELEHLFRKSWLYAGHVSELPQPGAYRLFEQFGQSIIISRGADDVIRAFKNTCRHRGAALVTEQSGVAKRFICPYHAWSYASDGTLKSVPEAHNFACLDKAEKPLFQVRCETWRGFIHINLDDNAEPLADFLKPFADQVGDFPLERMAVKSTVVIEIACNWKTAYDNFLEIYHVQTVHRHTIAPFLNSKSFVVTPLANGHARFTTRKEIGSLFGSGASEGLDERYKSLTVALPRFPNGFTALDPAGFNWMNFWPVAPDRMVAVSTLMGETRADPEEDRAYWSEFTAYQKKILDEDIGLFPTVQRSMEQGDLPSLVLSCQEQYLQWYNEHIDRKIGIENIPAHLRVEPVMTTYFKM
jgi:phenylpropionate dioxygenase-like ring-hydroxylating dioxygenase large terminal subunit